MKQVLKVITYSALYFLKNKIFMATIFLYEFLISSKGINVDKLKCKTTQ